jgi:flagellar hook-associated protein 2
MATIGSSSSPGPSFTAGGLASGLDTSSIVEQLVALESRPITLLKQQQAGLQTQVSQLGNIVSKLTALRAATDALAKDGVLAVTGATSPTAFSASPGSGAAAGRYAIQVQTLARAAKWRSAGFDAGQTVAGGTLAVTVQGKSYGAIAVADGSTLSELAAALRATGAPVSATVLTSGTKSWLSVTARDAGFPIGGAPSDALSLAFTPSPTATATDPGLAVVDPGGLAQNATFTVDGLSFTRTSNTVGDAVPGATLTLKTEGGPEEDLVLANDPAATLTRLQGFVDAYNAVAKLVQTQLAPVKGADRGATLAGDSAVRGLQARLQRLTSAVVPGLATVRSLADVGVRTARDGTLTIDKATLEAAVARDASAVNALFSTAGTGLGAAVGALVDAHTRSGDGVLTLDRRRLDDGIRRMDDQIGVLQRRVDAFRSSLIAQFTAMEKTVSALKAVSTFLASQSLQQQQGSK